MRRHVGECVLGAYVCVFVSVRSRAQTRVHFVHTRALAFAASDVAKHAFDNLLAFILNHIRDTCRTCVNLCAIYIVLACVYINGGMHNNRMPFCSVWIYQLRASVLAYCFHAAFFHQYGWMSICARSKPSVKSQSPEHTRCGVHVRHRMRIRDAVHVSFDS